MAHADDDTIKSFTKLLDLVLRKEARESELRTYALLLCGTWCDEDKYNDKEYMDLWERVLELRNLIWDWTRIKPPTRSQDFPR